MIIWRPSSLGNCSTTTLSASAQVCFANELRYSPTNSKAQLTPDVASTVAYGAAAVAPCTGPSVKM